LCKQQKSIELATSVKKVSFFRELFFGFLYTELNEAQGQVLRLRRCKTSSEKRTTFGSQGPMKEGSSCRISAKLSDCRSRLVFRMPISRSER
jgi:hypothetical protein